MSTLVTVVRLVVSLPELSRNFSRVEVSTSPRPTTRMVGMPV
jgi:hypothetical protein